MKVEQEIKAIKDQIAKLQEELAALQESSEEMVGEEA